MAKTRSRSSSKTPPPWKQAAPADATHTTLTPASRAKAKARARAAGRRYPNLVDNLHAAQEQRASKKASGAGRKSASGKKKR
jgi:hypothetical protein